MLGNKMDFSSSAIWTGFHKSSHILLCINGIASYDGTLVTTPRIQAQLFLFTTQLTLFTALCSAFHVLC